MTTRVEIRRSGDLSAREQAEYARARGQIDYGAVFGFVWSPKTWHVLVWADGPLASHAGILVREITVGGRPMRIGGVGGVWTAVEHRGRGVGRVAMQAAMTFLRDEPRAEAGLLLCRQHLVGFCNRLGWQRVPGPLLFDQPSGRVSWPRAAMVWL